MGDQFSLITQVQIPKWALWLAQDADGTWWAYEHEPNESHLGWYENEVGRSMKLLRDKPNVLWKESLQPANN